MKKRYRSVKMSHEALCAGAGMFIPRAKTPIKNDWVKSHTLYLATIQFVGTLSERVVTPVYRARTKPMRLLMMDAVTGTLYSCRDGSCLSSDFRRMVRCKKDNTIASRLLEIRPSATAYG